MEKEKLMTAMKTSISEVLETMFFLPLDFPEDLNFEEEIKTGDDNPLVSSKIDFSGPIEGTMFFIIPWKLACSLTANFLGIEEDEVDQQGVDGTVKELLNMITGKAFSAYDDQLVFNLGIPEILEKNELLNKKPWQLDSAIRLLIDTVDAKLGLIMVTKD